MSTKRQLRFSIVLRASGYSWSGNALQNAFGGTSSVPLPRVEKLCACCSVTTERVQPIRISAYKGHLDNPFFELPVCEHCSSHTSDRSLVELLLCLGAGVLALGIVMGILSSLWWLVLSCLAPCTVVIAFLVWRSRRSNSQRRALIESGHSPGLAVSAEPYKLTLETLNRRFARMLLELNPSAVLDHPHERFLYEPSTNAEQQTTAPANLPRAIVHSSAMPATSSHLPTATTSSPAPTATPLPPANAMEPEIQTDEAPRFLK